MGDARGRTLGWVRPRRSAKPGIAPDPLSPSQLAFANRTGAHAGLIGANGAVFFYREDQALAIRWLVDRGGQVLDSEQFSKRGP